MRGYTWEEYYSNFNEWRKGKRARNVYSLTSLGPAKEVGYVIYMLDN